VQSLLFFEAAAHHYLAITTVFMASGCLIFGCSTSLLACWWLCVLSQRAPATEPLHFVILLRDAARLPDAPCAPGLLSRRLWCPSSTSSPRSHPW
jgi:hypothetical protein